MLTHGSANAAVFLNYCRIAVPYPQTSHIADYATVVGNEFFEAQSGTESPFPARFLRCRSSAAGVVLRAVFPVGVAGVGGRAPRPWEQTG
jgi:hypothetical protein